ncbi:hypothetical protein [Pseudomonas taiwanensis]|uniref:hypothetical protein n=1 Tax=Pseudomonas taiwanensis TaxID=470150 RepID=UPI0015BDD063|nr:hypothetical protein [Pseudomonas taiwanensis]
MDQLSCDNPQDAIRSLSIIYGVPQDKIENVYLGDWPDYLDNDQYAESIDYQYIPWLMGSHVGGKLSYDLGEIVYYHRTRYDGSSTWFNGGLLCSNDGAIDFLNKTRHLYNGYNFDKIVGICTANIRDRTESEGSGVTRGGGPYAFDTLDDAKYGIGDNYDAPEMFCGPRWKGWCSDAEVATDLIEIIKKNLKPVVVKFTGNTSDPERYTTGLWDYLYRITHGMDYEPYTHTFAGRGVNVSANRIISLIDI